jgi:hypothetical protein
VDKTIYHYTQLRGLHIYHFIQGPVHFGLWNILRKATYIATLLEASTTKHNNFHCIQVSFNDNKCYNYSANISFNISTIVPFTCNRHQWELIQIKELINKKLAVVFVYEDNWPWVLPVDGTHVPKYVGETHSIFLLIKKMVWFGIRKAVRWYKHMHEIEKFIPWNAEFIPISHLLALLGAHRILHVSRIR